MGSADLPLRKPFHRFAVLRSTETRSKRSGRHTIVRRAGRARCSPARFPTLRHVPLFRGGPGFLAGAPFCTNPLTRTSGEISSPACFATMPKNFREAGADIHLFRCPLRYNLPTVIPVNPTCPLGYRDSACPKQVIERKQMEDHPRSSRSSLHECFVIHDIRL